MCGLWGAVSDPLVDHEANNVIDLAAFNVPRGRHSTGICIVVEKGRDLIPHHVKALGNSVSFFDIPPVKEVMDKRSRTAFMGHNRFATSGKITPQNAHPFHEGNIIGMHNGTISEFKVKPEEEDRVTDSRIFFQRVAADGLQRAVTDAKDGAIATTYINIAEKTLNLFRNHRRTLYWMRTKCGNTMYWSSEKGALILLKERIAQQCDDPSMVPPAKHHRIELGKRLKVYEEDVKLPESPVVVYDVTRYRSNHNRTAWNNDDWAQFCEVGVIPPTQNTTTTAAKPTHIIMPVKKTSVPVLPPKVKDVQSGSLTYPKGSYYVGFNNEFWSIEDTMKKLQGRECTLCPEKGTINKELHWHSPTGFVCGTCAKKDARSAVGDLHKGMVKKGN